MVHYAMIWGWCDTQAHLKVTLTTGAISKQRLGSSESIWITWIVIGPVPKLV